ncbi:MAG: DUF2007 domain-containing protein [Phycisphaerales bacterium]|nr:DUF2007 domain-containing protein [Phycisphaerales bacterium]
MKQQDPFQPVMLVSVPTEFVAHAIVRALEAVDVPATVFGGNLAGMRAEAPSQAVVMVRRMDLDRARVALESVRTESVDFDPEELAAAAEAAGTEADPSESCLECGYDVRHLPSDRVTCPECGTPRTRAAVTLGPLLGDTSGEHGPFWRRSGVEVAVGVAAGVVVLLLVLLVILGFAVAW